MSDRHNIPISMEILENITRQWVALKREDSLDPDWIIGSLFYSLVWVAGFSCMLTINLQIFHYIIQGADIKNASILLLCSVPCVVYAFFALRRGLLLAYTSYFYPQAIQIFELSKSTGVLVDGKITHISRMGLYTRMIFYEFKTEKGALVKAEYVTKKTNLPKEGDRVKVLDFGNISFLIL